MVATDFPAEPTMLRKTCGIWLDAAAGGTRPATQCCYGIVRD